MRVLSAIETNLFRQELAVQLYEDLKGLPILGIAAVVAFFLLFANPQVQSFMLVWSVIMTFIYLRLQLGLLRKKQQPSIFTYRGWTWHTVIVFIAASIGWATLPVLLLPTLSGWAEMTFIFMMFVIMTLPLPTFSSCRLISLPNPVIILTSTVVGALAFADLNQSTTFALVTLLFATLYLFLKYNRIAVEKVTNVDRFRQLTIKQKKLEKLEKQSSHDAVTGLLNFNGFTTSFLSQLQKQTPAYIISIKVNDAQNYYASQYKSIADELIKACAMRLLTIKHNREALCHVGMGEFMVGGFVENDDEVLDRTRVIENAFKVALRFSNRNEHVHLSIGFAKLSAESATPENLPFHAMTAMSQAATNGTRDVIEYTPHISVTLSNRLNLTNSIIPGLKNNEFSLVIQPKFDAMAETLHSGEILLRWHSEQFGFVSPVEFIPLAESSGDIVELGNWVLSRAGEILRSDKLPRNFTLGVNLSVKQLIEPTVIQHILNISDSLPQGRNLELELTESVLLTEGQDIELTLKRFTKAGIKLALDDFGTGYSSLSYLSRINVDTVKLDKSFIDPVLEDDRHQVLVSSIIKLVQDLGLEIVAEGVELEEQVAWLIANHCQCVQGYYFAKPMPIADFYQLIEKQLNQATAQLL